MSEPLEIERKFLILRPDETALAAWPGAYSYEIEQIYLPKNSDGEAPRIRRRRRDGVTECFYTVKRRLTDMTRVEIERGITEQEYEALRSETGRNAAPDGDAAPDGNNAPNGDAAHDGNNAPDEGAATVTERAARSTEDTAGVASPLAAISKTRWCLLCGGHVAEVDIYPFWQRVAVAEVELGREDEKFSLPEILRVIREVTGVREFLNRDMAYVIQKTGRPPREPDILEEG